MKGHFVQSAESNEHLRQTVSDMKYCPIEDVVITVGYDGALKVWNEDKLPSPIYSCSTFKAEKEQIQPLVDKHSSKNLFAFTTTNNSAYLFSYSHNSDGEFDGKLERIMHRTKQNSKSNEHNEKHSPITGTIDCVQFMNSSNASFISLTGNSESPIPSFIHKFTKTVNGPGGILEGFQLPDSGASKAERVFSFGAPGVGFSCSAVQGNSNGMMYGGHLRSLIAIGTGTTGDECLNSDGNLYLLDGNSRSPLVARIRSNHRECELISFSPCGMFLVSCNAIDNESLVYDIRFPAQPLHRLSHRGDPSLPIENVMSAYWSPVHPGRLWTGGADRFARVWDICCSAQDSLIGQFEHLHPVNVMGFDEKEEQNFVIGTLNDVSIYSLHPFSSSNDQTIQPTNEYFE